MIFCVTLLSHIVHVLFAAVLQGEGHSLTATRIFGTLALLNALRFPIMDLGSMLATIVSLYTSWHRLRTFFLLKEVASYIITLYTVVYVIILYSVIVYYIISCILASSLQPCLHYVLLFGFCELC